MSRSLEPNKRVDLKFDYNLYDAVRLEDNRTALITDYGIYDNQYWCEVHYPDGIHLAAGDYFSSDPRFYHPQICGKLDDQQRTNIIVEYIKELEDQINKYDIKDYIEEVKRMKQLLPTA